MGPAIYCPICNGSHPEGMHYTLRGAKALELTLASTDQDDSLSSEARVHEANLAHRRQEKAPLQSPPRRPHSF
jgi:hypothetical protein